jgi:hypothetical protein
VANRKLSDLLDLVREARVWTRKAKSQIKAGRPADEVLNRALIKLASLAASQSPAGTLEEGSWLEIPHSMRGKFIAFATNALSKAASEH